MRIYKKLTNGRISGKPGARRLERGKIRRKAKDKRGKGA
jgi:hypothetical protein